MLNQFRPVACALLLTAGLQTQLRAEPQTQPPTAMGTSSREATAQALSNAATADSDSASTPSSADIVQIAKWENNFFSHTFAGEDENTRLSRLDRMVFGAAGKGDDSARIARLKKALNQVGNGPAVPPGVAESVSSAASATANASPPLPSANATACAPAKPAAVPSVVTDATDSASSTSTSKPASTNTNPDDNPIRVAVLHVSKARFATALAPQQVIHNLNEAISEDPLDPELVYQRAKAYIQEDKLDRALSDLSDVIRQQPNRSDFYLARAWVYHLMGNQVLSNMDLQQARFVDPLFPAKIDWGK